MWSRNPVKWGHDSERSQRGKGVKKLEATSRYVTLHLDRTPFVFYVTTLTACHTNSPSGGDAGFSCGADVDYTSPLICLHIAGCCERYCTRDRRVRASASVTASACTLLCQSALLCSFIFGHFEGGFVQKCLEAHLDAFSVNNKCLFPEIKRPEPKPDHVPHNNVNLRTHGGTPLLPRTSSEQNWHRKIFCKNF
jgi:hypothetical protein